MPGASRLASGNELFDVLVYNAAVTFPTLAASASGTNTLTLTGAQVGDFVSWCMQAPPAHIILSNVYVSSANTLTLLWSTDGTGVSTATVPIIFEVVRGENVVDGGLAVALPNVIQ